ncbi:uncharacterized protein MYCFIDRAFT_191031 [Pseudocercospora fijiensis CIRAD86]|uniref:Uncharacterized protein n=1 Tax=Pseudocercospora fijiensis (strain CIRAD86) TaxID=383855 RepID=M2ZIL0_PSEFD|nr:uncharacterized protein MYCFIDRAFT_191031 [Pseudocercospora fijiensis CIRAD86]EME78954.1 hypothetical protein MYCFIDRAFT_191031 [Pseudocercospora fijiensis CIRAD86]
MRPIQIASFVAFVLPLFAFGSPVLETREVPIPPSVPQDIVAVLKKLGYKDTDVITVRLANKGEIRYIVYAALKRDCVPCSRLGDSWVNCHPGAYANDYRHSCNAIDLCRS